MSDVFKAIADPTRREILLLLAQQPTSVNTIAERFRMSRPAVSRHLKVLTDQQLVRVEPGTTDARRRICHAELAALQEVNDYLLQLETFWKQKLDRLDTFLDTKS